MNTSSNSKNLKDEINALRGITADVSSNGASDAAQGWDGIAPKTDSSADAKALWGDSAGEGLIKKPSTAEEGERGRKVAVKTTTTTTTPTTATATTAATPAVPTQITAKEGEGKKAAVAPAKPHKKFSLHFGHKRMTADDAIAHARHEKSVVGDKADRHWAWLLIIFFIVNVAFALWHVYLFMAISEGEIFNATGKGPAKTEDIKDADIGSVANKAALRIETFSKLHGKVIKVVDPSL